MSGMQQLSHAIQIAIDAIIGRFDIILAGARITLPASLASNQHRYGKHLIFAL